MWYESLPDGRSWARLWSGYVRCGCGGIRTTDADCPCCGAGPPDQEWTVLRDSEGIEHRVPPVFMGAEGRYEDWTYLRMLEREWFRPVTEADRYESIAVENGPSARAIVVLVFWTYFETRIERLFRETAVTVPETVMEYLLDRHGSVGARLDRLYKVVSQRRTGPI